MSDYIKYLDEHYRKFSNGATVWVALGDGHIQQATVLYADYTPIQTLNSVIFRYALSIPNYFTWNAVPLFDYSKVCATPNDASEMTYDKYFVSYIDFTFE